MHFVHCSISEKIGKLNLSFMCNRILPIRIKIKRFDNFHLWPPIRNFVKTRSVVSEMEHAYRWKQLVRYVYVLCSNGSNKIVGNILVADYQVPGEDSRDLEVVAICAFHSTGGSLGFLLIIRDRNIPAAHSHSPRRILYSSLIGYVCSADIPKPLATTLQLWFTLPSIKKKAGLWDHHDVYVSLCVRLFLLSFEPLDWLWRDEIWYQHYATGGPPNLALHNFLRLITAWCSHEPLRWERQQEHLF